MRHASALRFVFCSTLALTALVGCVSPGGYGYSADKYCYVSETNSPKTVSVMDTRTRQVIWSSEVPIGQQLVVKFFTGSDQKANMPDVMKYGFSTANTSSVAWQSSIPVPNDSYRRIDVSIRSIPELASGAASPAPAPAAVPTTATPKVEPKSDQPKKEMIDLPETEPPKTNPEPVREVK